MFLDYAVVVTGMHVERGGLPFATVRFVTAADAERAVAQYNGKYVGGQEITAALQVRHPLSTPVFASCLTLSSFARCYRRKMSTNSRCDAPLTLPLLITPCLTLFSWPPCSFVTDIIRGLRQQLWRAVARHDTARAC